MTQILKPTRLPYVIIAPNSEQDEGDTLILAHDAPLTRAPSAKQALWEILLLCGQETRAGAIAWRALGRPDDAAVAAAAALLLDV